MEQQINIQSINIINIINIIKAAITALLLCAALSLCRHVTTSRVSAPATTHQWTADSSWTKGGWR